MRKIKFRGKPIQMTLPSGEELLCDFVVGNLITHNDGVCRILVPIEGGFENYKIDPDTIGQFTSLYDKNGKEIYEGDILKTQYTRWRIEVRFVRGVFAFLWNGNLDDEAPINAPTQEWAEVIGNIHDNPELIKGGKK